MLVLWRKLRCIFVRETDKNVYGDRPTLGDPYHHCSPQSGGARTTPALNGQFSV